MYWTLQVVIDMTAELFMFLGWGKITRGVFSSSAMQNRKKSSSLTRKNRKKIKKFWKKCCGLMTEKTELLCKFKLLKNYVLNFFNHLWMDFENSKSIYKFLRVVSKSGIKNLNKNRCKNKFSGIFCSVHLLIVHYNRRQLNFKKCSQ